MNVTKSIRFLKLPMRKTIRKGHKYSYTVVVVLHSWGLLDKSKKKKKKRKKDPVIIRD